MGLTKMAHFLVEEELLNLGATFSKFKNWDVHTVTDGHFDHRPKSSLLRARREDPNLED
jgi:hypothetical protein